MTPAERRQWGQIGADISWANTPDRTKRTAPAREGLEAKFDREVREKHGDLPPEAHAQCVASLRRAYYRRIALKGVQARAAKNGTQADAA